MHLMQIPEKLVQVFIKEGSWNPCRYKGAYGGRGSGKTRTFAKMSAARAADLASQGVTGVVLCGRELQNSLDDSSFAEVKFAILEDEELSRHFDVGEKFIRTKCRRVSYVFQGLRHNIDSIKSKSRILICWIDEAEPVTDECWRKVVPTIREQGSEIWVTWNPERDGSATDKRFRKDPPKDSCIVEMNWQDNPWFMETTLNQERLEDKEKRPDTYGHVWEGEYLEAKPSAYFTSHILKAKEEGRWLVDVPEDDLMTVRLFADIGGTGARADNFVFWAGQFIGQKVNWVNHYESRGQPISAHLNWLRSQGYTPEKAQIWLPHDGSTHDRVYDVSYESALRTAGYSVTVVPNQGKGAAMQRVERVRNLFSKMWFSKKCIAGCKALAWYHEKIDDKRNIGLGPEHDDASHSSDSLGLGAIVYEEPKEFAPLNYGKINTA